MTRLLIAALALTAMAAATDLRTEDPAAATRSATGAEIQHSKYFANLAFRESPWADWKGIDPMDSGETAGRNHYRFDFDSDGRLRQISFRLGDRLKAPNHTANDFFLSPVISIDYDENQEIRHYFDTHGNSTTVRGDVFRKIFEVDENGNRTSLRFENPRGEAVNSNWGIANYTWEMQADGSIFEQRQNVDGQEQPVRPGVDFATVRLRYGPAGFLDAITMTDPETGKILDNSHGVAQYKLEFDAKGHMLSRSALDENGALTAVLGQTVATVIHTYTAQGFQRTIRYQDVNGAAAASRYGWWGNDLEYDHAGNLIRSDFVDADGSTTTIERLGYATRQMNFSADGMHQTELRYLDAGGNPVNHAARGFASYTLEYDRDGNLVITRNFDKNGKPVNRTDLGFAAIEYRYNERGQVIEQRLLDVDGNLVNNKRQDWAVRHYSYSDTGVPLSSEVRDAAGKIIKE